MSKYMLFMGVLLLTVVQACQSDNKDRSVQDNLEQAADQIEASTVATMKELRSEWGDLRDDIDDEVEEIDQQLETATEDVKDELKERKSDLITWSNKMDERLDAKINESEDDWDDFLEETKNELREIESELQSQ